MRYRIKARCADLGITMLSVLKQVQAKGHTLTPSEFSQAINGLVTTKRTERALECADDIIKKLEEGQDDTKI